MKDFIIIALLGFLILATYVQYKETRDLRIALVGKSGPLASDDVFTTRGPGHEG